MKTFSSLAETIAPKNIPALLRSSADAWEYFVSTGEFAKNEPRNVIAKSWQRCRDLGINPHEERARSVISLEEIDAKLHTGYLGLSAKVVLDRMAQTVEDTGHVIVLADKAGRMLYSVGHQQVQNRLENINFRPGSCWGEEVVGPNGIGTTLALGKPELVMGTEHYCQSWQPWVCYGAPIHNPGDQSIIGCIDITGPVENVHAETMALAVSISHSVELYLSNTFLQRREILRNIFLDIKRDFPSDGILVLDETGNVIEANREARNLLDLPTLSLMKNAFKQLYPGLCINVNKCLLNGIEKECLVELYNSITGSARCIIKAVEKGGERLGVAVLFPCGKTVNKTEYQHNKKNISSAKYTFKNLIGESNVFKETLNIARMAAQDVLHNSVLISGETGTGKELIAHAIHADGLLKAGPFISINCSALTKDLIESKLFGYAQGAYTGAKKEGQIGKFEAANNGTLFLDEIDSLDLAMQSRLLSVLDEKCITRLGSETPVSLNVRIISAASSELLLAVEEGRFRRDLYHRLNVIEIVVPPIRKRGKDVLQLLDYFLQEGCVEAGRTRLQISAEVEDALLHYNWPGNIRELRNQSARWVLTIAGQHIKLLDIPESYCMANTSLTTVRNKFLTLDSVEDELIRKTLNETQGNISKAAKVLGVNRSTIYRRINRWESK
jgi:sigma-54 dependent transcriptional regulator, acetoin dehydrogenase operon transcriptional activator AcoR